MSSTQDELSDVKLKAAAAQLAFLLLLRAAAIVWEPSWKDGGETM